MTPSGIRCILCGDDPASSIQESIGRNEPTSLMCERHTDQENKPAFFFRDGTSRLAGAWEQGPDGCLGLYLLLETGDLLLFTPEPLEVWFRMVPRYERLLDQPLGVPTRTRGPWRAAVREGWILKAVRQFPGNRVELWFPCHGHVVFSSELVSWEELGVGRYVLVEEWSA